MDCSQLIINTERKSTDMKRNLELRKLQQRLGSFDPKNVQSIRKDWWSSVQYPLAGANELVFFGNASSATGFNLQLTNIPKPGSFGNTHFLLKSIALDLFIADQNRAAWASTDVTTLASDYLYGFVQAGVLEMKIGSRKVIEIPQPFLQLGSGSGTIDHHTSGIGAAGITPAPHIDLQPKNQNRMLLEPEILIQSEEQFEVAIRFPSGAIPVLATTVVTAPNPLFVKMTFQGISYRAAQ